MHPITPSRGPNRRNSSFTDAVPALTIAQATRRTQMLTAGCITDDWKDPVAKKTRDAHLCRSTESGARVFIGDLFAQSQHRCFTQAKVTPKLFVWHVKRDLNIPPALVVGHVHEPKRYSEGRWLSGYRHFSCSICDRPTRWLFRRSVEPISILSANLSF
ncbi:hypothetical protein MRX96_032141 [Rhipicephalus microplus]